MREVLARRRERLTAVVTMLLREGIYRGAGRLVLQAIEEGPSFRRVVAERRALAILDVLFAAPCPP